MSTRYYARNLQDVGGLSDFVPGLLGQTAAHAEPFHLAGLQRVVLVSDGLDVSLRCRRWADEAAMEPITPVQRKTGPWPPRLTEIISDCTSSRKAPAWDAAVPAPPRRAHGHGKQVRLSSCICSDPACRPPSPGTSECWWTRAPMIVGRLA